MTKYEKYKLIILTIFGTIFLFIMHNYASNGRYIFREESLMILDTKTGTFYAPNFKVELEEFSKKNKKE